MKVQCELCPKGCLIAPGESGECRIRVNLDGKLRAVTYGHPCSVHVDPVEKKPIFHFLPGTKTFSVATVGCNLHCLNCQNWEISQQDPETSEAVFLPPEHLVAAAVREECQSISCTYTDPVVYYEYALASCRQARAQGLKTILVTAAYINRVPFQTLLRETDGIRIDLKSMSDQFYRDICGATLAPVLDAIVMARSLAPVLEIVHLIIPTLNDGDASLLELCRWIRHNLGRDVPLHFSRFFPQYRLRNLPPTPMETLLRARDIARAEGLQYLYIGNVMEADAALTACPDCGKTLVQRRGYSVLSNIIKDGKCPVCGKAIYGIWQ